MNGRVLVVAAVVLVLVTPVATWWLVGDRSERVPPDVKLDYTFRPVRLDPAVERVIGIGSVALAAICGLVLIVASARRRFDRRWWSVLGPVLVAAMLIGDGWRTLTAGTIGANIGAGLELMIGGPVVAGLLLYAGFGAWRLKARRAQRDRR
jgi:hypothetical protein